MISLFKPTDNAMQELSTEPTDGKRGKTIGAFFSNLIPSSISSATKKMEKAKEGLKYLVTTMSFGEACNVMLDERIIKSKREFDIIFKTSRSYKGFMAQMMILVGGFSAFLNNTPLVAVMMPYVNNWSKKHKISASKLLIPLSYAAILGGTITLIGTSTNLIVNGLVIDQKIIPNLPHLSLFDFTAVGLPMFVIGLLYILFIGEKFLPNNESYSEKVAQNTRNYIVDARVGGKSKLINKTIEEAGLRNIEGLYLVEIVRDHTVIQAVSSKVIIRTNDILIFAGETDKIAELINSDIGLIFPEVGMYSKRKQTEIIEIVISYNSSLINKTVKEINFRGKYDAAIIAIHRNGEKIKGKIGDIKLKAGDVLLLIAGPDFISRTGDIIDFYFMSKVKEINRKPGYKAVILIGGTGLAILLSAIGVISLFMALIILFILILSFKIASPKDVHKNIDYNLAIIIAMAMAIGTAMIKTGFADFLGNFIINAFIPLGSIGLLFGIYMITTLLAAYITNKAAVAIIFPISLTIATNLGLDPMPFILVVSFAAAANFMTPIGYQTNLMVYGPGRYKFKDFFRIGAPLTIIYMIVTVFILHYLYF